MDSANRDVTTLADFYVKGVLAVLSAAASFTLKSLPLQHVEEQS
jgi:hypothetical protein